jgi:hypothetical protein
MRTAACLYCKLWLHSRITSTKSTPLCMTSFSASLPKLTVLLSQSHDNSCYVSRRMLAPPPLWLQKHTDLRAHGLAHSPDMWRQPRLANLTCAGSWRLNGINPAINVRTSFLRSIFFLFSRESRNGSSSSTQGHATFLTADAALPNFTGTSASSCKSGASYASFKRLPSYTVLDDRAGKDIQERIAELTIQRWGAGI